MERTLAWEKWISPLEKNLDKVDPELMAQIKQRLKDRDHGDPDAHFYGDLRLREELEAQLDENDEEDEDYDDGSLFGISSKRKTYKILVNQFGIFAATEQVLPNESFNFWIGHTNFRFNNKLARILEYTDGVESLEFYSDYRFRIGIGKQFKASEVHNAIERNLDANNRNMLPQSELTDILVSPEKQEELEKIYRRVSKSDYWAIYVLPNESIEAAQANSADDLTKILDKYHTSQELVGGQVISS